MDHTAEEFEIRQLTRADISAFKQLITIFNLVFEEDESAIGGESYLEKLLGNRNFIAMAAFSENEVVGGLTAHELPLYYSDTSEIFVYDVAVKREFQRLGIGKRLIHKLKEYCSNHGINEFFVLAHEEDEEAVEFYHSTGGKSEKVINFLYEASVPNK
jgi:aminoglycoside 3-N-acetyltransferase I